MFGKTSSGDPASIYRFFLVLCFILFAAVVRILPHPWNFAPLGAMALFSGAKLSRSWKAFLLPLVALFCGDLFVGLYTLKIAAFVYFSFSLSVLIGSTFRRRQSPLPLSFATFLGALQFFLVTNFAVWAFGTTYSRNISGLVTCYVRGLPYFGNTLAGDAFYGLLFFGGFALLERFTPTLARRPDVVSTPGHPPQ
jgi:hypothetical protein